jgi:fatty-acyl-CoA synthase
MEATPAENTIPLRIENFSTLTDALDYTAKGKTGFNFYTGRGRLSSVLPYSMLREEAITLARRLGTLEIPRGARVALVADTHPDFVRFFFACQYAGMTPVPLPAQIQLNGRNAYVGQLKRLLSICQAELAMATDDFLPFLTEAAAGSKVRFSGSPGDFDALPESNAPLSPSRPDELAYLQYTSGSTRFPRGVMITQKAVLNNLYIILNNGIRIQPGDRAVSWLPYFHDMGLVGLLLAPIAGQFSVDFLNTRDFAMRPRLWLKLMSENRATISFSPPFGYDLVARRLRDDDVAGYDLRAWRVAGIGAELIRTASLASFAERLAPSGFDPGAFLPCYGMAECSLAVCFGALGAGVLQDHVDADRLGEHQEAIAVPDVSGNAARTNTFVNCGAPLPGYEIEIRDPSGRALSERECGVLHVRGASVMSGYFGDLKATREVLSPDGWLNTGDLAYRVGSSVFITGRAKDLIIVNGRNIWPQDIEYLVESQPEIRTGDASAFSCLSSAGEEHAVVMVQCRQPDPDNRAELTERLNRRIREELGIDCVIALVPRNTLIRTTSGKPSRHGTRKVYLERIAARPPLHGDDRPAGQRRAG